MDWFTINTAELIGIILTALGIYLALMIVIRINGLRTLSKMGAHDFVVTVALGTIMASVTLTKSPSLMQGIVAMATLIILQSLFSAWRLFRNDKHLENKPLLLMENGKLLHDNLMTAGVTEDDVIAKLRKANVHNRSEVRAVVLEVTGDVSVLHSDQSNKPIEDYILHDVVRSP